MLTIAAKPDIVSLTQKRRGGMVMRGGIYLNKGRHGAPYSVQFPGGIHRRFWNYEDAENFLIALNFKAQEGTLDPRDYRRDAPLGSENLGRKWLDYRSHSGVKDTRHARLHMERAISFFGNANIKTLGTGQIEDFFVHLRRTTDLSSKSLYDIRTTLHTFWAWVVRRERHLHIPQFPEMRYTLGWRKIVDKETQEQIIEEVRRISWSINPRVYIGIMWLATYPNVRPLELIHIREEDIDLKNGLVVITHNKVPDQYKRLYLLDEDIALVQALPRGLPKAYFFRHESRRGLPAAKRGRFGKDYLYTWWRRACANLGIKGVDLYGGTRHSTVSALSEEFGADEIMHDGTGHTTSKAFARYFQIRAGRRRAISAQARPGKTLVRDSDQVRRLKRLKSGD